MSESREPSYYEIALTNTQVLVAFGILLLCVSGAFVSGMWVARESLRDRLEAAERAEVAPVASEGEAQQETFEFFGDEAAAEESTPPVLPPISSPRPAVESSAAERADQPASQRESTAHAAESEPAEPEPAEREAAESADTRLAASAEEERGAAAPDEPGATEAAAAAAAPRREPEPSPSNGAGPATEAREASEGDTTAPEAGEPKPGAGAVVIQVLSSSEEQQANVLIARLRADGYRAFLSPVEVDGRTMYRVRVGPYPTREAAEVDADKIKRTHRLDTWFPRS